MSVHMQLVITHQISEDAQQPVYIAQHITAGAYT